MTAETRPIASRGFAKLDCGIVDSTLWMLDHDALRVWIAFLAKCDALGVVRASVPALAHLCRVTVARFEEIVELLCAPDPYSRTEADDGRRLRRIEGGFVLLNYLRYRELAQRKAGSHAERQARYRLRLAERDSVTGDAPPSRVTQKEKQKQKQKEKLLPEGGASGALAEFDELWAVCLKRCSKGDARAAYLKHRASGVMPDLAAVKSALQRMQATPQWSEENRRRQPYLATWLNREGWADEPATGTGSHSRPSKGSSSVQCGGSSEEEQEALRNLGRKQ